MQKIPLKDIKNNTVIEVGIDDVGSMVASGHYALPKNAQLPILNPDGEIGEINSSEYISALQSGYVAATSADIQKQIDVEQYGDSPLKTGLERAASSATFGATDFIASQLEPEYAERMRKREELNPVAAMVGEITGVVGPALLSGGTSLVGKLAAKTPVGLATAAGESITAGVAKAIGKSLPKNALAAKIISETVPRAAGLGVEGALYGAGNYISDASLGNAEWSAESLISNVGMSGLLGAGLGAGLGAAKLVGQPVLKKVKGWNDVNKLAEDVTGMSTVKASGLTDKFNEGELAKYIVNDVNGGALKPFTTESLAQKAASTLEKHNGQLDDILKLVGKEAEAAGSLPEKLSVGRKIEEKLNSLVDGIKVGGAVAPAKQGYFDALTKVSDDWKSYFEKLPEGKFTLEDLNALRKQVGEAAKYDRNGDVAKNMVAEINGSLYGVLRQNIDDIAETIGQKDLLKETNRKIWMGIKIQPFLDAAEVKAGKTNLLQLRDYLAAGILSMGSPLGTAVAVGRLIQKGAESELGKSARLIYGVKAAERKLDVAINDSVRGFFLNTGKAAKAATLKLSTQSSDYEKTASNVEKYASNPEAYLNDVNSKHAAVSAELPTVTAAAEAKGALAMQFLASKLPKSANPPGMIPRKYIPSTQERAKFMRYAEIIENPKKALQHFQSGKLSSENVQALKAVYPELFKKMTGQVAEFISMHGDKLPYNKKIQLGTLMGIPADSSMTGAFISRMQVGFTPQAEAGGQGPGGTNVTGLNKMKKAGRLNGDSGL